MRAVFTFFLLLISSNAVLAQNLDNGLAALEAAVDAPGFSGAVVVMREDEIVFAAYRGMADQAAGRPVTADTRFNAASASKFITALGFVRAARAEGLDPARVMAVDLFADRPDLFAADLTIAALLAHASTAESFFNDDPATLAAMQSARSNADLFRLTASRQGGTVARNPQGLAYSNSGYIFVGEAIERLSGQTYEAYLSNEIFGPLGVTPRFTRIANAEADRLALPYVPAGYDYEAELRPRDGASLPAAYPERAESPLGDMISSAAGGLYITARDFAAIGAAALAGDIIDPEDLVWMCTSVVPVPDLIFGKGCGGRDFGGGRQRWGHNGGAPGVNTEFALYPDAGLVLVVLSNHNQRAGPVLSAFEAAYFGAAEPAGFVVRD